MIETLYYSNTKTSNNLEKQEPQTTATNSKPLTSSSIQSGPIYKNPKENVKIICQNSQSPSEILNTTVEDTEDIQNLQNGIILIVEDSVNSIPNTEATKNAAQNETSSVKSQISSLNPIPSENNENSTTESKSLISASYNNIDNSSKDINKRNGTTSTPASASTSTKNDLPQYWEARTDNLGMT